LFFARVLVVIGINICIFIYNIDGDDGDEEPYNKKITVVAVVVVALS